MSVIHPDPNLRPVAGARREPPLDVEDMAASEGAAPSLPQAPRTLGSILVETGRLTPADVSRVLAVQRESGLRFGEVAVGLELLTNEQLESALAEQYRYPYLVPGHSNVSGLVVMAYQPFGRQAEAVRALRTQLSMQWLNRADRAGTKTLAITSLDSGDGRSWLAANLAVAMSQLGERTLLIDADMRRPVQHTLFDVENGVGLSGLLVGKAGATAIQRVRQLPSLAILPAGAVPPNPQELLTSRAFSQVLEKLAASYDAIIIDTPPAGEFADAHVISGRSSATVVVMRQHRSELQRLEELMESLKRAGAQVVGAVLADREH